MSSGGSKNVERGSGRQFISPVLIYRKCTQRSVGLLNGKGVFLEKMSQYGRAAAPTTPPFESATAHEQWRTDEFGDPCNNVSEQP